MSLIDDIIFFAVMIPATGGACCLAYLYVKFIMWLNFGSY